MKMLEEGWKNDEKERRPEEAALLEYTVFDRPRPYDGVAGAGVSATGTR